jgi:hypothetical protein
MIITEVFNVAKPFWFFIVWKWLIDKMSPFMSNGKLQIGMWCLSFIMS